MGSASKNVDLQSGINCLIRLAASVMEKALGDDQSLVTEAQVDTFCAAFIRSPSKSTRHAA
jgi:hypothetical protein